MKIIGQLTIILIITFIGVVLNVILPLPIPASIYGFIIMLLCLYFKIIKLDKVREVGDYLLKIMPMLFVPASVGLMTIWGDISQEIPKILFISMMTTVIVMVVTGRFSQFSLKKEGENSERNNR